MTGGAQAGWVVVKLGGTSTASRACLENLADAVRRYLAAGHRVLVVHSALSGVTDRLEGLAAEPDAAGRSRALDELLARHRQLAGELGVDAAESLARWRAEIDEILAGGVADDPGARARLLARGELMAGALVVPFLRHLGLDARGLDARDWLRAVEMPGQAPAAARLSAVCDDAPDPDFARALGDLPGIPVTQGFIARNDAGQTVLLGRGGSDTSAAYFAARLSAARLEIWTDVPGLFSANPQEVPGARLLRRLGYAEAQEIATSGARVLHPRCIGPVRRNAIPLLIVHAPEPGLPGTAIGLHEADTGGRVKAIAMRRGVTLVTMETVGMWHQVGFLADAFQCFRRHGLSIDMVSTSETSVTVTLDPLVNPQAGAVLEDLLRDLAPICRARCITGCAAVSLVGRQIRANLHRLAPALEVFEEREVHLVSQAANDLNLTFVVNGEDALRLVRELHALLVQRTEDDTVLGPTWEDLRAPPPAAARPWWQERRAELLELAARHSPVYVYEREALESAAREVTALPADRVFFAVKANAHAGILSLLAAAGVGFECVSPGELAHVTDVVPGLSRDRILYTPNFAPRTDYEAGLASGAWITLDNLHPLGQWPELFRGRDVLLRVDPGNGAGHHRHVRTAGVQSKFGIPWAELGEARALAARCGARVIGLHMHLGSGILETGPWREAGGRLAAVAREFPDVRILDVGGGLGVIERADDRPLDLVAFADMLAELRRAAPHCEIWLEPGRFLVARAGVLLTRVTQLKGKGELRYVGVDTGMNSLIRPALYGAHHAIVNLTRHGEAAAGTFDVVGPICETGDVLGRGRRLPEPREGDVLLIANAGAYGRVMASRYNLREPATEVLL